MYQFDLSPYGSPSTFYVAFDANMDSIADYFYIDNVEFISPQGTTIPVCMPDQNAGPDLLAKTWQTTVQRWDLEWDFDRYPSASDAVWDPTGVCQGYEWANYNPLTFQPGDIFTMIFQAAVTLSVSGTYYNEVLLADDAGLAWFYNGPTAGVSIPQYDLKAVTSISTLRANTQLTSTGISLRSWHWEKHR